MVERLGKWPEKPTEEQYRGMDAAAREAVRKAAEELDSLLAKAAAAAEGLRQIKLAAGLPPSPPAVGEEQGAAAESREEKEESPAAAAAAGGAPIGVLPAVGVTTGGVPAIALPPMPADRAKKMDKALATNAQAKQNAYFENFQGDTTKPDKVVALWLSIRNFILLGLSHVQVLTNLQLASDKAKAQLAASTPPATMEEWRQNLSRKYLSGTGAAEIRRNFTDQAQRRNGESAATFLLRIKPAADAVLLIGGTDVHKLLEDLWSISSLQLEYCQANQVLFAEIEQAITTQAVRSLDELIQHVQRCARLEIIRAAAKTAVPGVPGSKKRGGQKCKHCDRTGHKEDDCWTKYPEKRPAWRSTNNERKSEYLSAPNKREVFVVDAILGSQRVKLGLDSMAALNLMREDAVPLGVVIQSGGPQLHGVGQAQAKGTVRVPVMLSGLSFAAIEFAVVDSLPVPALLGKPTLSEMSATINLAADMASVSDGTRSAILHAVAVPARASDSARPEAQSYWNWLNKRFAAAPKRLQTLIQDTLERADDDMLEKFLAEFPAWSLSQRQALDTDDPIGASGAVQGPFAASGASGQRCRCLSHNGQGGGYLAVAV